MKGEYRIMMFNSMTAQLNTEQGVTEILSHFSSDFIMDVVQDSIVKKFRPYTTPAVNYPLILERDFIKIKEANPSYISEIEEVRSETYREIIGKIARAYNLEVSEPFMDESDGNMLYSVANVMYTIFVSDFTGRMITLFSNYMIANADSLCRAIDAINKENDEKRKEQNVYSKRIPVDHRIVVLHNNMDKVLDIVSTIDLNLDHLLHNFVDPNIADFLSSILVDKGDIYKNHYVTYIRDSIIRPDIFTISKLNLQSAFTSSVGVGDIMDNKGENR